MSGGRVVFIPISAFVYVHNRLSILLCSCFEPCVFYLSLRYEFNGKDGMDVFGTLDVKVVKVETDGADHSEDDEEGEELVWFRAEVDNGHMGMELERSSQLLERGRGWEFLEAAKEQKHPDVLKLALGIEENIANPLMRYGLVNRGEDRWSLIGKAVKIVGEDESVKFSMRVVMNAFMDCADKNQRRLLMEGLVCAGSVEEGFEKCIKDVAKDWKGFLPWFKNYFVSIERFRSFMDRLDGTQKGYGVPFVRVLFHNFERFLREAARADGTSFDMIGQDSIAPFRGSADAKGVEGGYDAWKKSGGTRQKYLKLFFDGASLYKSDGVGVGRGLLTAMLYPLAHIVSLWLDSGIRFVDVLTKYVVNTNWERTKEYVSVKARYRRGVQSDISNSCYFLRYIIHWCIKTKLSSCKLTTKDREDLSTSYEGASDNNRISGAGWKDLSESLALL